MEIVVVFDWGGDVRVVLLDFVLWDFEYFIVVFGVSIKGVSVVIDRFVVKMGVD